MHDLVSIGDIKLDVFLALDRCKEKCDFSSKWLSFQFGEKISVDIQDQQIAGSAPNVAVALSRMGKKTAVISNMGDDLPYELALKFLKKEKVASVFVKSHRNTKSAYSAVLTLKGEKTILVSYIQKKYHLPKNLKTHWLYMSEMGNGYETIYKEVLAYVKKEKALLGFNPGNEQIKERKPVLYKLIKEAKTLFVNVEEGQRIVKTKGVKIQTLADRLFKLGPTEVVITNGKKGAYGYDGTNLYFCSIYPGRRLEATGAGDAFASGFIGARMHGHSIKRGLEWGSINAASCVSRIGPTLGLLSHTQIQNRLKKVLSYRASKM